MNIQEKDIITHGWMCDFCPSQTLQELHEAGFNTTLDTLMAEWAKLEEGFKAWIEKGE